MLEMVKPKLIITWFTICMKYIITHNQLYMHVSEPIMIMEY